MAIESVLMQKVDFNFELIIADDCSTDGTREILEDYQQKYPDKIKLLLQENNIGAARNWIDLMASSHSKYIAYFEGDDYWTDPEKLQLQVDYLEKHPEQVMCFHNADVINEDGSKVIRKFNRYRKTVYQGEDLLRQWLIPTASIVFRNILIYPLPDFIQKGSHGDLAFLLYLSQYGKIGFIDRNMSVYRINELSLSGSRFLGIVHNELHIEQCRQMEKYFSPRYKRLLQMRIVDYMYSTAYLYAKEKNGKMALSFLKKAFLIRPAFFMKSIKYASATLFLLAFPNFKMKG